MGDPEIRTDEKVLLRTPGVYVKSIPFEGILTTKRIILVDRAKNLLPPKEIPLATIKSAEAGENAIRDQILTLSVLAKTGETRQMVLTFSRQEGGNRIKERDEWLRQIQGNIGASFENVIRKVIPGADSIPRRAEPQVQPRVPITTPSAPPAAEPQPFARREAEGVHPTRKIIDTAASPAVKEFDASQLGQAVFCNRCGNKVPADSAFCNRCGSPVVAPGSQAATPATPPAPSQAASIPVPSLRPIDQDIGSIEPLIEKSAQKIPADPLRKPIPDIAVPKSIAWDDDTPETAVPVAAGPAGAEQPPAKRGFLPRLFSPKEKTTAAPVPSPVPSAAPPVPEKPRRSLGFAPSRSMMIGIGAAVLILVIIAVGALVVYPMIAGGGLTLPSGTGSEVTPVPTSSGSSTAIKPGGTIVVKETVAPAIPPTGVYVHVNYLGGFKGSYGAPDARTTVPGNSGDRIWEVENANMTVIAEFEKLDGSAHELLVEIYKDGKVLTRGSTTTGHGFVKLSVDALTGTAAEPVTSGGGTAMAAAATMPVASPASTTAAAAVTTTAVTTAATQAPVTNTTTAAP